MKKITVAALTLLCALMCAVSYASGTGERLSRDVVRLHIIANSNGERDQELKLKVRDAVLAATDSSVTKENIPSMLDVYRATAERTLRENGCDMPVSVEYGRFSFPTKSYEGLTYPAGEYDAVRIVIGEGKGENWWCVLFPPLCYVRGSVDSSAAAEQLKKMLAPADYELLTSGADGALPVRVRFKIVEWYNKIKN